MPYRTLRSLVERQEALTTASVKTTVRDAARLMRETQVGALLIMEHERVVGIFTERDALFRVLAEGFDPETTPMSAVMTPDPLTVHPDKPFVYALHLMHENGFRHVLVAENGRPLGMVSARDALAPEAKEFQTTLHQREHLEAIMA
ncbi:MAG: CBS domain-containing protein [Gammaproteobacteria bacterium]|nr:CBS domain-containing protein [Gammaproteobacteria bacterium]